MSLSLFIAKTGTNPNFIAFMAHSMTAAFVVYVLGGHYGPFPLVPLAIIAAGLKEFWFDAKYEVPKQTFDDNMSDFMGYMIGIVLACVLHVMHV